MRVTVGHALAGGWTVSGKRMPEIRPLATDPPHTGHGSSAHVPSNFPLCLIEQTRVWNQYLWGLKDCPGRLVFEILSVGGAGHLCSPHALTYEDRS